MASEYGHITRPITLYLNMTKIERKEWEIP